MMEITEEELKAKIDAAVKDAADEVARLAAKNTELLDEVKGTKRKKAELEESQRLAEEQKAIENGEFKNLLDARTKELDEERANSQAFRQQVEQKTIDLSVAAIAASVSSDDTNRYLLTRELKDYASIDGEQVKYTVGGVDVDQKAVIDHIVNKFPSLVDGNPASGDNAKRGAGQGGGGAVAFKDMSRTEKTRLAIEDPVKYKQLSNT